MMKNNFYIYELFTSIEESWSQLLFRTLMMGRFLDNCNNTCKNPVTFLTNLERRLN